MNFTIVRGGVESHRDLQGPRTLAEVLTREESQQLLEGHLVAVSSHGMLLSLRSPVTLGDRIELKQPDAELLKMFRLPSKG